MLKSLEHIGIAVSNLRESLSFFEKILGLKTKNIIDQKEDNIRVAIIPLGTTKIELFEPLGEGSVKRFLDRRGEGLHHLAFEVSDVERFLKRLKEMKISLIDEAPRIGVEGFPIAFLHPKSTKGVLIEICEKPKNK